MSPAMLFGTAGDHIEVVIGVLLGFLLVLWALTAFVQWIKTAPWKRSGLPAEDDRIAGRVGDDRHQPDDVPHDLPRFAMR
ncbi:MAG TPA: hypothetical protein VFG32_01270 [Bacteroidota bacterium]|nr:hypothetical protein [Bacteroidota bacterium]